MTRVHQQGALEELQKEHPRYFDAIQKAPRLLVGTEVPSLNGEGMERLKDSADAADWIEGAKSLLSQEVQARARAAMEEDEGLLKVVHSSIELFQNNRDLVPNTKQFDKELADNLVALVKPYEHRIDGKLIGYTIPLQPLVDKLRADLATGRAAKATAQPPAAATPPAATPPAPKPTPPAAAPQAGVPSSAGQSAEVEDFSTLFGTIGLSDLRL